MPSFGARSRAILATVDPALVEIMERVVKHRDITILSGKRGKGEQDDLFARGLSKTRYPHSKHNQSRPGTMTSLAVDIAPYPINWKDTNDFIYVAGMVMQAANDLGHTVRWGGDWGRDGNAIDDQTFNDLGHFELVL
jgi:peptidoglycan L-alanyl-D-glutamate endopeptidase CwlK